MANWSAGDKLTSPGPNAKVCRDWPLWLTDSMSPCAAFQEAVLLLPESEMDPEAESEVDAKVHGITADTAMARAKERLTARVLFFILMILLMRGTFFFSIP